MISHFVFVNAQNDSQIKNRTLLESELLNPAWLLKFSDEIYLPGSHHDVFITQ